MPTKRQHFTGTIQIGAVPGLPWWRLPWSVLRWIRERPVLVELDVPGSVRFVVQMSVHGVRSIKAVSIDGREVPFRVIRWWHRFRFWKRRAAP